MKSWECKTSQGNSKPRLTPALFKAFLLYVYDTADEGEVQGKSFDKLIYIIRDITILFYAKAISRKENDMADKDYGVSTVEELEEIMKQYQEENSDKEE